MYFYEKEEFHSESGVHLGFPEFKISNLINLLFSSADDFLLRHFLFKAVLLVLIRQEVKVLKVLRLLIRGWNACFASVKLTIQVTRFFQLTF